MALKKSVLLDGRTYGWHVVQEAVTNWDGGFTRVNVMSWADEASVDDVPHVGSIDAGLIDGITLQAAYELVDAQWPEYVDQRDSLIEDMASLLTDEQAEQVPNAYPEWAAGTQYAIGDRRRYQGTLYRCVQAHASQQGWEPPNVPALWVRTAQEGEIPEWVQPTGAHDAYAKGDKVRHDGRTWVSLVDANVWEPGTAGTEGLWGEE